MARKKKRRQAVEKAPTILKVLFQEEVTPNRYDDVEAFAESAVGPGTLMRTIRGWRVAKSLDRLLAQVNRLAPDRSKASDGAIGDAKHQSRESDHNPWVTDGTIGVVTARDITNDPKHGCSAEQIANSIVASKDPRIKIRHLGQTYLQRNRAALEVARLQRQKSAYEARPHIGPA